MADRSPRWSHAVSQGHILQSFSVNIKPIGSLAIADLPSFEMTLFTSQPVAKSAIDLNSFVMQRLNLPVQPVFYVLIAGKQSGMLVSGIIEQFKGEIFSRAPLSVFEESDVTAGVLTTFCDLAVAPKPALAPGPAPAAGKQRPASSDKPKLCPALTKAANKAVLKYWTRIKKNIDGKAVYFFALRKKGNQLDAWVMRAVTAFVCEESPTLAAILRDPKQEMHLEEHVGKYAASNNSKIKQGLGTKGFKIDTDKWLKKFGKYGDKMPPTVKEMLDRVDEKREKAINSVAKDKAAKKAAKALKRKGPDGGSGVAGATPDSVAAGAAPAGVIAEAAVAGEDLAAEFVSTVAPPEPRRKKARTPAATPLTGATRRAPERPSKKQPLQQEPELSEDSAASSSEESAASSSDSECEDGGEDEGEVF